MKVLVIQPKIGMGDMVIYLPYIHAISKKYQKPISILVKENSRANQLLLDDKHIDEIIILDRTKDNSGSHDGLSGFFKLSKEIKSKNFDKVLCVIAKKKIRRERVLRDKKFTKKTLQKIFKFQVSDKERKARSNIIIYNNDTKKDFIFSLEKALIKLLK